MYTRLYPFRLFFISLDMNNFWLGFKSAFASSSWGKIKNRNSSCHGSYLMRGELNRRIKKMKQHIQHTEEASGWYV